MSDSPPPPRKLGTVEVQLYQDPQGIHWYLARCPACQADLSTVCLARLVLTPEGIVAEIYHPMRCPECRAPMLPVPPRTVIVPARELPRA